MAPKRNLTTAAQTAATTRRQQLDRRDTQAKTERIMKRFDFVDKVALQTTTVDDKTVEERIYDDVAALKANGRLSAKYFDNLIIEFNFKLSSASMIVKNSSDPVNHDLQTALKTATTENNNTRDIMQILLYFQTCESLNQRDRSKDKRIIFFLKQQFRGLHSIICQQYMPYGHTPVWYLLLAWAMCV